MRKEIIFIFLVLNVASLIAQDKGKIIVEISGFRNNCGLAKVAIFNSAKGFPDCPDNALLKSKLKIINKTVTIEFSDLPFGFYAIGIIHDENMNDIMDSNWNGIPKEGYAVSKNVTGYFGPPIYDDAKIELKNQIQSIKIIMIY